MNSNKPLYVYVVRTRENPVMERYVINEYKRFFDEETGEAKIKFPSKRINIENTDEWIIDADRADYSHADVCRDRVIYYTFDSDYEAAEEDMMKYLTGLVSSYDRRRCALNNAVSLVEKAIKGSCSADEEMYHKFRKEIDTMSFHRLASWATETGTYRQIEYGTSTIGFIMIIDGYVEGIYVEPQWRRGHRAKRAVLDCIKDGIKIDKLHIVKGNQAAQAFWNSIFDLEIIDENIVDRLYEVKGLKPGVLEG